MIWNVMCFLGALAVIVLAFIQIFTRRLIGNRGIEYTPEQKIRFLVKEVFLMFIGAAALVVCGLSCNEWIITTEWGQLCWWVVFAVILIDGRMARNLIKKK